jgi:hypothetical protein
VADGSLLATPDLLLKHSDKLLQHAFETLAETLENTLKSHCKIYATSRIKHFQYCVKYMQHANKHTCNIHLKNI